jgi:hypothetical protein
MGRFGLAVIFVFAAAIAADQYWNYGYYTDSTMSMLAHIKRSFSR